MTAAPLSLSIILPVLNEAPEIVGALEALRGLRGRGAEVIVVDGGSTDATALLAGGLADFVIASACRRATQMNAGAGIARGDVLLFLHADTRLPEDADQFLRDGLARSGRAWGRFDVMIEGGHPLLRIIATAMNWRSRLTGIATGDQAMFVTRGAFRHVGGFPEIALMEDIALSRHLKRVSRPLCLAARVATTGRRWKQHGVWRTMLLMWRLRLAYFFGADPTTLARRYNSQA